MAGRGTDILLGGSPDVMALKDIQQGTGQPGATPGQKSRSQRSQRDLRY